MAEIQVEDTSRIELDMSGSKVTTNSRVGYTCNHLTLPSVMVVKF